MVIGAGNFYQTDDQINFGGHTNKLAYYASANGNRTNLGLETPTSAVIHDAAHGYGGFGSLIYNRGSKDQVRLVAQLRRDYYQVPFDPQGGHSQVTTRPQFLKDINQETDAFTTFSWVHTFGQGLLVTVSLSITTTAPTTRAVQMIFHQSRPSDAHRNMKVPKRRWPG